MRFQAIIQIILLILAIVIATTVIRPKLAEMRDTQQEIDSYQTALDNIDAYNRRLQSLISQADSMSEQELESLYRYLPEEVDDTVVSRDVTNVVEGHNLLLLDITASEPLAILETVGDNTPGGGDNGQSGAFYTDLSQAPTGLVAHQYIVNAIGGYTDMKAMLQDFERNVYPLRLIEYSFEATESDLVEYVMTLETYSLPVN